MRGSSYAAVALAVLSLAACAGPMAQSSTQPSSGGGFGVAAGLQQSVLSDDNSEYSGPGSNIELAYDFTPRFGAFADVGGVGLEESTDSELTADATYWNLGARYTFDAPGRRFVPYLQASYATLSLDQQYCDDFAGCFDSEANAAGFGWGGGLRFHFTPSFALDGGIRMMAGTFTEVEVDGETVELEDENGFMFGRFLIGIAWRTGRDGGSEGGRTTSGGGPK